MKNGGLKFCCCHGNGVHSRVSFLADAIRVQRSHGVSGRLFVAGMGIRIVAFSVPLADLGGAGCCVTVVTK